MSVRTRLATTASALAVFILVLATVGEAATARKPVNTSSPTISGVAREGQILTASAGTWSGSTPITYRYQWQRCSSVGASCKDVSGATATTYKLVTADVGRTMRVRITASNAAGATTATSAATAVVQTAAPLTAPVNTSAPTVSGTAQEGQTLTAGTGTWSGTAPITYAYHWQRCVAVTGCGDILGATADRYTVARDDVGATIRVAVMASNTVGWAVANSPETAPVLPAAPSNVSPPTLSGTAQDGQTLTADAGTWDGVEPISYAGQWQRCDSTGTACQNIVGATGPGYTLGAPDVGATIRVRVSATNAGGTTSASSARSAAVAAMPGVPVNASAPTVSGIAQEGQTLTAGTGTWSGTAPIAYAYQWLVCDGSGDACSDRVGATSETYVVTADDVGGTLRVTVEASNTYGSAFATSAQTSIVQAAPPPPPPPPPVVQPNGPPGTWALTFDDEFVGSALDRSKWTPVEGWQTNNVTTRAANVSVANGEAKLVLSDRNNGGLICTCVGPEFTLPVGGVAEARVYFPGSPTEHIFNWPAWWVSGDPWPDAGEHDIAEGLGGELTVNYHGTTNSANYGVPAGTWYNGFHMYTLHRNAASADVYWDGTLVRSYPTGDNGTGDHLIVNAGSSGSRTPVTGDAGAVRVDYVRAWVPG
jgi:Glycosyl hydrolases family 16/Ig domain of plant-specific actin-binding protein